MPRLFGFPFPWASDTPSVATQVATATPGRWTNVVASGTAWTANALGVRTFHRIHTQPVSSFGQSINFGFRVNNAFPLKVSSADPIHVASMITNP